MTQETKNPAVEAAEKLERQIAARIKELKKSHSEIFVLQVTAAEAVDATEDKAYKPADIKVAYLKPVTRQALSMATAMGQNDPFTYNEIIMRQCWIDGDEEIRTNDSLFINACRTLDSLIEFKEAEIKKY